MAERGDTHYSIQSMNRWFLFSAFLLLASTVWMVIDDWDREWKGYQREYQAIELERANAAIADIRTDSFEARTDSLHERIDAGERLAAGREEQIAEASRLLSAATVEQFDADQRLRFAKATLGWERYLYDRAAATQDGADRTDLDAALAALGTARARDEKAIASLAQAQERLDLLTAERDDASQELEVMRRDLALIESKVASLEPGVVKTLWDAPGLDFVAPTIKVRKQVLPNLRKNYNFLTVQRVDMCASCHVSIDKATYAENEQPLAAHPRLDLYVSPSSPHPIDSFGCTVCHEGAPETLDFTRAVHTPADEHQAEEWAEKLDWHEWHLWEWPMYPKKYTEAGCYACHIDSLETIADDAPQLSRGLALMEERGCYGCHKIQGWRIERKVGPSLAKLTAKVPDRTWTRSWIRDPRHFRESTWMPQLFHQENTVSEEWDDTTIAAIEAYLAEVSQPFDLGSKPEGNIESGEALFEQVGCLGCHSAPGSEGHEFSEFGPDLAGVGSKVSEDWLYEWIRDPKRYWDDTRMPDLRLTEQEAADVAAYVMTFKADGWEPVPVGHDPATLRAQLRMFLERKSLALAADEMPKWEAKGDQAMLVEMGRRWVNRQGCFGCHEIPGFEEALPLGTELTDWGNKDIHKLAFNLFSETIPGHHPDAVPPTRHGFARRKMLAPRSYDWGLEVSPFDRLRMPNFHFTEEEADAIVTVLLGMKDESETIRLDARPDLDTLAQAREDGRFLLRRNNCYGCHRFTMDEMQMLLADGGSVPIHGLVTLEDDDEEATFFQLWKTAADLADADDPSSGQVGTNAFLPWEENDDEPWPVVAGKGGGIVPHLTDFYLDRGDVASDLEAMPLVPPFLYREGEKVQTPWLTGFLKDPFTLRPWLTVRMPTFGFSDEDARTLAVWFAAESAHEWPSRYARALRSSLAITPEELESRSRIRASLIRQIENGERFPADAFERLRSFGDSVGFNFPGPPSIPFEPVKERSSGYLASLPADHLDQAADLVSKKGIDCYQCHIRDGKNPGGDKLSWGPDLMFARERLRADWIREWISNAQRVYPGTKMPTASDFVADPKLQAVMSGSPEHLLDAIRDFLMNSDRVVPAAEVADSSPSASAESEPGS